MSQKIIVVHTKDGNTVSVTIEVHGLQAGTTKLMGATAALVGATVTVVVTMTVVLVGQGWIRMQQSQSLILVYLVIVSQHGLGGQHGLW